jgi:hypothetical protein
LATPARCRRDGHDFHSFDIDRFDVADEEVSLLEQLADRVYDVRRIEIAGGDFMQHRREQKKVIPIDQSNSDA